jgi:hypothetical protein
MPGILVVPVLLVGALDCLIFSNLDSIAKYLDRSRQAADPTKGAIVQIS